MLTMNFMNEIGNYFPKSWDESFSSNYSRYNVEKNSVEFKIIFSLIGKKSVEHSRRIQKLERIQNVFAYGQMFFREQFLLNKNIGAVFYRVRRFIVVRKNYLDDAIKYNLDPRRIGLGSVIFSSDFKEVLSSSVLLIVIVLTSDPNVSNVIPTNSSEYCIEYVVYFN